MKQLFSAVAFLAIAACQTEEGGEAPGLGSESLPVDVAGPGAGALELEVDGALRQGNTLRFTVTGALPGERVFVLVDNEFADQSFCAPFLNGLCIDLPGPSPVKSIRANDEGIAAFRVTIPNIPAGQYYFQAATLRTTAATSNVVGRFTRAASGLLSPFVFQDWILSPNDDYVAGGFFAGAFADDVANPDAFACFATSNLDGVAATPCPDCEYAFTVNPSGGFVETELDAECASYVGTTTTFMDWFFAAGTNSATGNPVSGGWAGLAGGATWAIDEDYDLGTGATAPYALFNDPGYGWYPLGQADVGPYPGAPTYTEVFFGIVYSGSFYY